MDDVLHRGVVTREHTWNDIAVHDDVAKRGRGEVERGKEGSRRMGWGVGLEWEGGWGGCVILYGI